MNNIQIFNNDKFGEVRFITIEEKQYAAGKDVAKALGYADASSAISKKCRNGIKTMIEAPCQNGNMVKTKVTFIPESDIYRLIFGSKLPDAEKFQDWVFEEVLPELRKNKAYIMESASSDNINFATKFGPRRITNTFLHSDNLEKEYNEYILSSQNQSAIDRLEQMKKIKSAIEQRIESEKELLLSKSSLSATGNIIIFNAILNSINDKIIETNNRIHGSKRAVITKENNRLKDKYEPSDDKYVCIKEYPISKNALLEAKIDEYGHATLVKSKKYHSWEFYFTKAADEAGLFKQFSNIDFTKDVYYSYKVVAPPNYDTSNLIDPLQDVLAKYFHAKDDKLFHPGHTEIIGTFSEIEDARIYLYLTN